MAAEAELLQKDLGILQNAKPVLGQWLEYPEVKVSASERFHLRKRYPRNAQCPCGSGRKFKKCCGS
jgi:uncharacterized protein YecA (UPF0149 family)